MPADHRNRARRLPGTALPLRFEIDHDPFEILIPSLDDDHLIITGFGEATRLAFDLRQQEAAEVMVLLDEQRRVTAILLDPPPPIALLVGRCDLPCLEVPFCHTIDIVYSHPVVEGPPSRDERAAYLSLRRLHMLQGLQLLDVILVDGHRIRSMAVGCDPDPIWFEQFEPFERFEPFEPVEPAA
jgi:hypothetical protein